MVRLGIRWKFRRSVTPYFADDSIRAGSPKKGSDTLTFGALTVHPGDFILADVNGIVSLPPARLHDTIALASEIAQKDTRIKGQLRAGLTLFEILNLQQYMPRGNT